MPESFLSSLLLLPAPPTFLSAAALKAAYQPAITSTFTKLVSLKLSKSAILEITIPWPGKYALATSRSQLFAEAQHLLAGLYSLICIVSARTSIEPEGVGGVDARVIFLVHNNSGHSSSSNVISPVSSPVSGPIIDLETFALNRRNWSYIFSVDGEQGQECLNQFLKIANRTSPPVHGQFHKIQGGVTLASNTTFGILSQNQPSLFHTTVAVGGTFDHLHAGHKLLLTATAFLLQPPTKSSSHQRRLIIGITGDELLKNKKYATYMKSWKEREQDVVEFLLTILSFNKKEDIETVSFDEPIVNGQAIHTRLKQAEIVIECVKIQDPFGPTITDESVTALVVSGETRSGGAAVNTKREEKGWEPLEVFEVEVLNAGEEEQTASGTEEFASKISSTAIRKRKAETAQAHSASL